MEAFVLDASVAIAWCFPNDPAENTPYNRAVLQRIGEADIGEYVGLLKSLPIRVVYGEWLRNVSLQSLARKHNLAAYDVSYIELALREKLSLATSDKALKKAALAEGVTLI